jgi:nicotinamide phosphoribosyltransferase
MNTNPMLFLDGYKTDHRSQYPEGTQFVYSNLTARATRMKVDKTVFFGLQGFIKEFLIEEFNKNFFNRPKQEVLNKYKRRLTNYGSSITVDHIADLHDLGYLPIEIKALPEGSRVPLKVPYLTIVNTHEKFFWITNYLETLISSELWKPITSATTAYEFRKLADNYALETTGNTEGVQWQCHDFSMRGMSGVHDACVSGAGHLLSFTGTDTIPAIDYLEQYYNADSDKELIGASVPATEHSVMSLSTAVDSEFDTFKRLITETYPNGIVSIVSDTFDFWQVVTEFLPKLKSEIEARDGKCVIRPDSNDPVDILCGFNSDIEDFSDVRKEDLDKEVADYLLELVGEETPHGEHGDVERSELIKYNGEYLVAKIHNISWNRHDKQYYYIDMWEKPKITYTKPDNIHEIKGLIECLWDTFGGHINQQGYKVLSPKIGAIYGDSITLERANQIFEKLKQKGFASTNVVLGIGSYTYQYVTRDTHAMAVKATWGQVKDKPYNIFKDPKTDNGTKKSAKGLLKVERRGRDYYLEDQVTPQEEKQGSLRTVFLNGKMVEETSLSQIRNRLLNK